MASSSSQPESAKTPGFPIHEVYGEHPKCKTCGSECKRHGKNNKSGRPYYACFCGGKLRFSTWDDDQGVKPGNPLCLCGFYCRVCTYPDGNPSEACPIGKCNHKAAPRTPITTPKRAGVVVPVISSSPARQPQRSQQSPSLRSDMPAKSSPARPEQSQPPPSQAGTATTMSNPIHDNSGTTSSPANPPASPGSEPGTENSSDLESDLESESESEPLDEEFVRLLEHLTEVAGDPDFPIKDKWDADSLNKALKDDAFTRKPHPIWRFLETWDGSSPFPPSQFEQKPSQTPGPGPFKLVADTNADRHTKVGAAGEYFVHLFLRCQLMPYSDLPVITEKNWGTKARNLVATHLKLDWPEVKSEGQADIIFLDRQGAFTNLLIDHGHLDRAAWAKKRLERPACWYYIEVKSSLRDTNKEFYMTDKQHEKIRKYQDPNPANARIPTVFVIVRVSNLQEHTPTVRVYVNPLKNRRLKFTLKWAVEELEEEGVGDGDDDDDDVKRQASELKVFYF